MGVFLGGMSVFHAFWGDDPGKDSCGACPAGGLPAFVISVPATSCQRPASADAVGPPPCFKKLHPGLHARGPERGVPAALAIQGPAEPPAGQ